MTIQQFLAGDVDIILYVRVCVCACARFCVGEVGLEHLSVCVRESFGKSKRA